VEIKDLEDHGHYWVQYKNSMGALPFIVRCNVYPAYHFKDPVKTFMECFGEHEYCFEDLVFLKECVYDSAE